MPASSIWVSIDSCTSGPKIICRKRKWMPASTARISTFSTTAPTARPTLRRMSWWISATRPMTGAASVKIRSSSWASSTASLARNWNSEYTIAWKNARNPAPVRLPSVPVK